MNIQTKKQTLFSQNQYQNSFSSQDYEKYNQYSSEEQEENYIQGVCRQFSRNEENKLKEIMSNQKSLSWKKIVSMLQNDCSSPKYTQNQVRQNFGKLTQEYPPKLKDTIQYFNLLLRDYGQKWFNYVQASKEANQRSLYKNSRYAQQFIKHSWIKVLLDIQKYGKKQKKRRDNKQIQEQQSNQQSQISIQSKSKKLNKKIKISQEQQIIELKNEQLHYIAHFLTRSSRNKNTKFPQIEKMRWILTMLFLKNQMKIIPTKIQMFEIYIFLCKFVKYCVPKKDNLNKKGPIKWNQSQLTRVYKFYKHRGSSFAAMVQDLQEKFGQKLQFSTQELRLLILKIQLSSLKTLTQKLQSEKERQYEKLKQFIKKKNNNQIRGNYPNKLYFQNLEIKKFPTTNKFLSKLVLSTQKPYFLQTSKLMSLSFNVKYSISQLIELYNKIYGIYEKWAQQTNYILKLKAQTHDFDQ